MPSSDADNSFKIYSLVELQEHLDRNGEKVQEDHKTTMKDFLAHIWHLFTCPIDKVDDYYRYYVPRPMKLILAYYLTGGKIVTSAGLAAFDLYNTILKLKGPEWFATVWAIAEAAFNGYTCSETRAKVLRDFALQNEKKSKVVTSAHLLKATKSDDMETVLLKLLGNGKSKKEYSVDRITSVERLLDKTECKDAGMLIDKVLPPGKAENGVEESDVSFVQFLEDFGADTEEQDKYTVMATRILAGNKLSNELVDALRGVFDKGPYDREFGDFVKLDKILKEKSKVIKRKRLVRSDKILVDEIMLNKAIFYNNYLRREYLRDLFQKISGSEALFKTEDVYLALENCLLGLDYNAAVDALLHYVVVSKYLFNIEKAKELLLENLMKDIAKTELRINVPTSPDGEVVSEGSEDNGGDNGDDEEMMMDEDAVASSVLEGSSDLIQVVSSVNALRVRPTLLKEVSDVLTIDPSDLQEKKLLSLLDRLVVIKACVGQIDAKRIHDVFTVCEQILRNFRRLRVHMGSKYERMTILLRDVFDVPLSEQDPESFIWFDRALKSIANLSNQEIIKKVREGAVEREKQFSVAQIRNNPYFGATSWGLYGISWFGTVYALVTGALGADTLIHLIPKINEVLHSDNHAVSLSSNIVRWTFNGGAAVCGAASFDRFQAASMDKNVAEFLYIFHSLFTKRGRQIFTPASTLVRMGIGLILAIVLAARATYDLTNSMKKLRIPTDQWWAQVLIGLFLVGYMTVQVFAQIVKGVAFDNSKLKGLWTNMPHSGANRAKTIVPSLPVLGDSISYSVGAGISMIMLIGYISPILDYLFPPILSRGVAVFVGFLATFWPSFFFTFHEKYFESRQNRYVEKEIKREQAIVEVERKNAFDRSRAESRLQSLPPSEPFTPGKSAVPRGNGSPAMFKTPGDSPVKEERVVNVDNSSDSSSLAGVTHVSYERVEIAEYDEKTPLTGLHSSQESHSRCCIQ
ncbi:MAG: hypothetical protein KAS93_05870 [Gammaproteobacteria bacterium]|nr:hypothetical protein [Gammaproteobacteria bacterium]